MYTFHYPVIKGEETGKRLREIRISRKLSVSEVARDLGGISEQAVYKWERGACLPSIDNLLALSHLYHVQIEAMLVTTEVEMASSFFVEQHGERPPCSTSVPAVPCSTSVPLFYLTYGNATDASIFSPFL